MNKFNLGLILRLLLFAVLSAAASTPLQLFNSIVIEKMQGPPDFVSVPFLIYAVCVKVVFGLGYVLFGHRLPVKNTVLRAFAYIMLILFSSYLPNVLGMAGGDGEIIGSSFSAGIVIVDSLSYIIDGLILGLLMKKYAKETPAATGRTAGAKFILSCAVNGALFAALNLAADFALGTADHSWRLCGILKVTPEREVVFYTVFIACMFIAGCVQPVWYRYCLHAGASLSGAVLFALKLAAVVWLPNVLIMAFFGTLVIKTLAYGALYMLIFAVCVLMYKSNNKKETIS